MKKLLAVLMALGLIGFIACSAPAESNDAEGTEESGAMMDEMESNMDEPAEEMAEETDMDEAGDMEEADEAEGGDEMEEPAAEEEAAPAE